MLVSLPGCTALFGHVARAWPHTCQEIVKMGISLAVDPIVLAFDFSPPKTSMLPHLDFRAPTSPLHIIAPHMHTQPAHRSAPSAVAQRNHVDEL
jgi:hypothetical protein